MSRDCAWDNPESANRYQPKWAFSYLLYCHSYIRWKVFSHAYQQNPYRHWINVYIYNYSYYFALLYSKNTIVRLKLHTFRFQFTFDCQSKLEWDWPWKEATSLIYWSLCVHVQCLVPHAGQTKFWRYSGDSEYWSNNCEWTTSVKHACFNILPLIWIILQ